MQNANYLENNCSHKNSKRKLLKSNDNFTDENEITG